MRRFPWIEYQKRFPQAFNLLMAYWFPGVTFTDIKAKLKENGNHPVLMGTYHYIFLTDFFDTQGVWGGIHRRPEGWHTYVCVPDSGSSIECTPEINTKTGVVDRHTAYMALADICFTFIENAIDTENLIKDL